MKLGPNKTVDSTDGTLGIELVAKDGTVRYCYINREDYPLVKNFRWYAHPSARKTTFYAYSNFPRSIEKRTTVKMHRLLMGFPDAEIDHDDGNGLNNTRENIQLASPSQNRSHWKRRVIPKSGFRGVRWWEREGQRGKWHARIQKQGKAKSLGYYDTKEEAALVYDRAAQELYGDFAILNFPAEQ